jgi:hypothetical protein
MHPLITPMLLIFSLALPHLSVAQNPNELLLKNYRPSSIYRTPQTKVEKASFLQIDMHAHPYMKNEEEPDGWIKTMDELNIDKSVILTYQTGKPLIPFIISLARKGWRRCTEAMPLKFSAQKMKTSYTLKKTFR